MSSYTIRHATNETDGEALLPLARDAVDEAQGPHSTRRAGSDIPQSSVTPTTIQHQRGNRP